MKKQVMMALTMLSLVATLAVTTANAQSRSHFMRISVPFQFNINSETLPPGTYTVKRASSDKPGMLLISGTDGSAGVYILTNEVRAKTHQIGSKLVFNKYGDQYFLSQVWAGGDNEGRQLFKSRRGRATGLGLANITMKRQTVTVVARQR